MKMPSILARIGNTPLLQVGGIFAKLETVNPTGSVKDRMAWYMVRKAEERGQLRTGMEIIEATSGNNGVSLAMISAVRGYGFTAVMPESGNQERAVIINAIRAFGGRVVLTPAVKDVAGAVEECRRLAKGRKNIWLPNQFESIDNIAAHREGLGREILRDTGGDLDAFVAGAGSGGTIIGVAEALKAHNPRIQIVVIEPAESHVLSGGCPGLHGIQGIGEGFIPKILKENLKLVDQVISIKSSDAVEMSKRLALQYGVMVGTSSGANMAAAFQVMKKYKKVVTILADRGEKYLPR